MTFAIGAAAFAQVPEKAAFEVATVKPAAESTSIPTSAEALSTGPKGGPGTNDPSRWTCKDCNLRTLIVKAYDVKRYQLIVPGSIDGQHYDITAKVPAGASKDSFR